MTAWGVPWVSIIASIALAHSMAVVRPGASAPGSDSLWLGRSNATTRCPASTSGLTNTAKCARWPPQPCTRYIGGPSPHSSPATRCPSQCASIGLPEDTPGGMRRLDSRTGGVHHSSTAQRDPRAGASRSSSQKRRRTLAATGGRTPEPATSSGGTSPACALADAGPVAPRLMSRDRSVDRRAAVRHLRRVLGVCRTVRPTVVGSAINGFGEVACWQIAQSNRVEARGFEPLCLPAETPSELRILSCLLLRDRSLSCG
jgi:hypothetical protein